LTDEELGCNHERLLKAAKDEYTRTKKLPLGRAEEGQARCEMLDDIKVGD
jgi:hypothetical protein